MSPEILPYQAEWSQRFAALAETLRQALGNLVLRIDHIGSTAVPGLAAKDVIDIQITVPALDPRVITVLQGLGYLWRPEITRDHRPPGASGEEADWEKWFFTAPPGQPRVHLHVRVQGRANQRYPLLFRDYLRAHPATAAAYAELKRRLARYLPDPDVYSEVKDPAGDLIYLAAEEWAATTGWQPADS
ncbi:MAG: GrpB family protein [Thermanaerothrix sp.]|uniref:GrpB family protein n=2 Tax=Thermanaerothrix TaxID=1077886 RepID=A0ABU3NQS2_9CHLR|nr:GrpB family protein [Thermanaerothrix sp. 4228-RoL]MDT8898563.1 GrpB family protein [Thermanaerothrix sp. 4228-RoL]